MATFEWQVIRILCTVQNLSYEHGSAIRKDFAVTYVMLQIGEFTLTESTIQTNCTT